MIMLRCHWGAVNFGFGYLKINPLLGKVTMARQGSAFLACHVGARHRGSSFGETLQPKEAPALDPEWATADCKKLEALQRSSGTVPIYLTCPESVATTNGVPISPGYSAAVCIRRSAKYATMTGTAHTHHWLASRDPEKNWMEPLMGWTSSSDPYASMSPLAFPNEPAAVSFCEKNGYSWYIQRQPPSTRDRIVRRYEDNFHWSKRCRLSTR